MAQEAGRSGETLNAILDHPDPGRPALIGPDDGQILSYGQLAGRVGQLAGSLAAAGVRRGDRVAFTLPNGPEVVQILLAITALGAAAAPLNPAYTDSEYLFYLSDIEPRFLLVPASLPAAATGAARERSVPVLTVQVASDGRPELFVAAHALDSSSDFEPGQPDDVGVVLHTSGTTSRPKQVPLRQRNLMASTRTIAAHYGLGPSDVSFCVMPLFHVHGLVASTFAALAGGGSVIVPRRFTPRGFWAQAREHGATWLSAGPTLHQMILDRADGDGPPASLRFARSCSSALSPALLARAEQAYGVPMLEAYGMTEASHQMASNPLPPRARIPGSVGIATGTEIAIADQSGNLLANGAPGEVVLRGPGVMASYANNPAATAEAFFGDWFRTGDRGVLRDGYLYLEGRLKEMILRGGENISPAEIEQALLSHPAVRDAVCFGVADEKYGELVSAAVTLTPEAGDVTAKDLTSHCRESLAAFKVPVSIHILDQIPRTATGKIQRRRVAEFVAGGPGPDAATGQPGRP
jgi:acyl-CoA synthetase (AMP-forming)/AMP-acid ligase II